MNNVSHPSHYTGGEIECKDAMRAAFGKGYCYGKLSDAKNIPPICFYWWGCVFKYIWRWKNKNGIEDLCKARQCIDFLIEELEKC